MNRFRSVRLNGELDPFVARVALNGRCAGLSAEPARDNHGPSDEEVRQAARIDIADPHLAPVDAHVGERGVSDPAEEIVHHVAAGIVEPEVGDGAAPGARHAFEQVAVHGGAHAETEDSRLADGFVYLAQDLGFVADVAVGQERDETQPAWVVRKVECGANTLDHHRAAVAIEPADVAFRPFDVSARGGNRFVAEAACVVREADDLKRVSAFELIKRGDDCRFGLADGLTAH